MRKLLYSICTILALSCNAHAYHNFFFRDAGDITTGIFNNSRIDSSSVTKQGNLLLFYDGYLHFQDGSLQTTAAGSSQWTTNGSNINNTNVGNVGIGTTVPGSTLTVNGTLASTSTTNLASNNGNVSIGNTAGSSRLDISGGSVTVRGAGAGLVVGGGSLTVQTGGNVGVGTLSPSSLLDISGGSVTVRGTNAGVSLNAAPLTIQNASITVSGTASEINVSTVSGVASLRFLDGSSITTVATQAQMEAATSSQTVVTPARQQYHPGTAKAYVAFAGATGTAFRQYNVSSVGRTSAGIYTVNFTAPFSDTNYGCVCTAEFHAAVGVTNCSMNTATTLTVSAIGLRTRDSGGSDFDADRVMVACFGDQ